MSTWGELAAVEPERATAGRELLDGDWDPQHSVRTA